ncbi:NAD(P)-dependent oxidoreductase [Amycolatopsis pithecellobii]|uniref:NAD-binding protein n=1 Tax=Amycolatopsis pithecellobii TaxID=664692 RepID=A0A6N7YT43_9PSEU|nr:NAD(P)-dependent oxidoreductase [Amycolatopsis pithecellobii]MTD55112.1 NAD-binding protein [Amycolatopsis pithecellobii]
MSTKDQRVGFIGLGHMGSPMAARLIDAGYDVTVWSRTQSKADGLVERGATRAAAPQDAVATGVVFSMLSNENAMRDVFTGELLRAAPEGFTHVCHATISPGAATEFEALAGEHGTRYLSAPVLGRPDAVEAGRMTVLASGDPEVHSAVRPMLEAMGKRVWDYGPSAAAAPTVKIAVNYLIVHALQALAESVTILEKAGLDTGRFVEMINDSLFPGPVYGGYGKAIATGTYTPPGFTTTLGHKDLMLAVRAAEDLGVELPTGPVLREVFEHAIEHVGADLDWACVAEVTRRRAAH